MHAMPFNTTKSDSLPDQSAAWREGFPWVRGRHTRCWRSSPPGWTPCLGKSMSATPLSRPLRPEPGSCLDLGAQPATPQSALLVTDPDARQQIATSRGFSFVIALSLSYLTTISNFNESQCSRRLAMKRSTLLALCHLPLFTFFSIQAKSKNVLHSL